MITAKIESDFLRYLLEQKYEPGDRLPSLNELSEETGIGVGKLREQLEVVRTLGLIDARPDAASSAPSMTSSRLSNSAC